MKVWVEAARPRTLPAGVVPVLVGTAASPRLAAVDTGGPGLPGRLAQAVSWPRFLLALVVAVALQVGVNYANDYFDGVRGVDTEERVGPRRLVASGLVAPPRMRTAVGVCLAVAGAAGLALAVLVGWELLLVGLAALAATLTYSGGPRPYGARGLGEVAVFVFFGLIATVGSTYVQAERITGLAVLAAVPVGLLAVALLVVNNLRDVPTDAAAGKRTLAVRLGVPGTRRLYVGLVVLALASLVPMALTTSSAWLLLPVAAGLPLAGAVRRVRTEPPGPGLVAALESTGRAQAVLGVLLSLALVVGRLPAVPA